MFARFFFFVRQSVVVYRVSFCVRGVVSCFQSLFVPLLSFSVLLHHLVDMYRCAPKLG